jgi:hypothetical protein
MVIHICYIFFEDILVLFVSLWPLFMHGSGNYLLLCAFLDVKFTKMHPLNKLVILICHSVNACFWCFVFAARITLKIQIGNLWQILLQLLRCAPRSFPLLPLLALRDFWHLYFMVIIFIYEYFGIKHSICN